MPAPEVFVQAMHAITPAGAGSEALWQRAAEKQTCVARRSYTVGGRAQDFFVSALSAVQWAAVQTAAPAGFSRFEALAYAAAATALQQSGVDRRDVLLVLSTTKGNIDELNRTPDARQLLYPTAQRIAAALGLAGAVVVSQACVSGLVAAIHAARLLQAGRARHALVVGADLVTPFVLGGFQSFHALAPGACRPFDKDRAGINLGEGAGAMLLSREPGRDPLARLAGGAMTNDANHISGPSRTGEELGLAIHRALAQAGTQPADVDAISAHGTATLYNDEMESKAFAHAGVSAAPLHSLKGITGHTLGAAGALESIIAIESLRQGVALGSAGFAAAGVSGPVQILEVARPAPVRCVLKTASGFGGVNAAGVWVGC